MNDRYTNRELSWLDFNYRILSEEGTANYVVCVADDGSAAYWDNRL